MLASYSRPFIYLLLFIGFPVVGEAMGRHNQEGRLLTSLRCTVGITHEILEGD